MICLIQLLYWEATSYGGHNGKMLSCADCIFVESCNDEAKEPPKEEIDAR